MGRMVSSTVIVVVQLRLFPLASVAVRVTLLAPVLLQSNVLFERLSAGVPQLSLTPALTCAVVRVALPVLLRYKVIF